MRVFNYKILSYDSEEIYKKVIDYIAHYPYGEEGLFVIEDKGDTVYSSQTKALDAAKNKIEEYELNAQLIIIECDELDNEQYESIIRVYNLNNNRKYEFSWQNELNHEKCIFKKGEWVLFYGNGNFQIGKIGAEAEGEEPYLLLTENNALSDGYSHDHVPEAWIIKSLEESEVEKILPYKFYSNIKIRYELYELKDKIKQQS